MDSSARHDTSCSIVLVFCIVQCSGRQQTTARDDRQRLCVLARLRSISDRVRLFHEPANDVRTKTSRTATRRNSWHVVIASSGDRSGFRSEFLARFQMDRLQKLLNKIKTQNKYFKNLFLYKQKQQKMYTQTIRKYFK